jgi:hypothetical protein
MGIRGCVSGKNKSRKYRQLANLITRELGSENNPYEHRTHRGYKTRFEGYRGTRHIKIALNNRKKRFDREIDDLE